jgi:predicted ATPase
MRDGPAGVAAEQFARMLSELRGRLGLSQEELAHQAKIGVRTLGDLERAVTRRPHRDTVRSLADALSLTGADREAFHAAARAARQIPGVALAPPARVGPQVRGGSAAMGVRLPAPLTPIIGREAELAALRRMLSSPGIRLVTITGPGGGGKTRLALEYGWRCQGERIEWLDSEAAPELSTRTGAEERLVIVDGVEYSRPQLARLSQLLTSSPGLRLLVTGRAPLGVRGEHVLPLGPLPQPDAVELLEARVRAGRPGFARTPDNEQALVSICALLDGLPLALELAAARLHALEPQQLLAQLRQRPASLTSAAPDLPDRHQSLAATIAWSVRRLSEPGRRLLGVLSAFAPGEVSHEHLDGVAGPIEAAAIEEVYAAGLALAAPDGRSRLRHAVYSYAARLLDESGCAYSLRQAHAEYFLALLDTDAGPDDDANIRAALAWAIEHEPRRIDGAVLASLAAHLERRSAADAGEVLLSVAGAAPDPAVRAGALHAAGVCADRAGAHRRAVELAARAAEVFAELDDVAGECGALTLAGNAHKAMGDYAAAIAAHEASLRISQERGDLRRVTVALNNLGTVAHDCGDHARAREHYLASLRLKRRMRDRAGVGVCLVNLGALHNDLREYRAASRYLRAAVREFRSLARPSATAFALALSAEAELGSGHIDAAGVAAAESVTVTRELGPAPVLGLALARLGDVHRLRGDEQAAEALYQEALECADSVPERVRTLDRLAAVTARRDAAQARQLLRQAAQLRRLHRVPTLPADRHLAEQARGALRLASIATR